MQTWGPSPRERTESRVGGSPFEGLPCHRVQWGPARTHLPGMGPFLYLISTICACSPGPSLQEPPTLSGLCAGRRRACARGELWAAHPARPGIVHRSDLCPFPRSNGDRKPQRIGENACPAQGRPRFNTGAQSQEEVWGPSTGHGHKMGWGEGGRCQGSIQIRPRPPSPPHLHCSRLGAA